jgi:hypothetical protein
LRESDGLGSKGEKLTVLGLGVQMEDGTLPKEGLIRESQASDLMYELLGNCLFPELHPLPFLQRDYWDFAELDQFLNPGLPVKDRIPKN